MGNNSALLIEDHGVILGGEVPAGVGGKTKIVADKVVTVSGTLSGDYATLNAALLDIYNLYYVDYKNGGITVEIKLLAGFVMQEQISFNNIDMRWIIITSEDTEVVINRSSLTIVYNLRYPVFYGVNSDFPIINVLFNMNTTGTATDRDGLYCFNSVAVLDGGFKNCSGIGLNVCNTRTQCSNCVFTGCGIGINANRGSVVDAISVNASGCGYGIKSFSSNVVFISGIASLCTSSGIMATNSVIDATSADLHGCTSTGITGVGGSCLKLDLVNVSGSATGISADGGTNVSASSATANNCSGQGILANNSSTIACYGATATGCGTGIQSINGSIISAATVNASGCSSLGIYAGGGRIHAYGANARKGASNSTNDFVVYDGGIINATGPITGGLLQTKNTITTNGIIFAT